MSTLKSLLVHLDASAPAAVRLSLARQLAQAHHADLSVLYAVTPAVLRYPAAFTAEAGFGANMTQFDDELRERARKVFEAPTPHGMPQGRWQETTGVAEVATCQAALVHDLMILGQASADVTDAAGVANDFVQTVVMDSGRPALVVPYIGAPAEIGKRVMVAWKGTREAARALTAAIPFMKHASEVHVVTFGQEPTAGVLAYLASHGIHAQASTEPAEPEREVGDLLLSQATDLEADLLVMGCFGHSRAREWILGGATHTLLQSMTIPVLLAH
jgi:nucleotide-binding universal stress UspA family protein